MEKISAIGIIPARFGSTRFPGKPLVSIAGKPMIQRVYEQCLKASSLQKVLVATDDNRIADTVLKFGGEVVMTSECHQSGTDRCQEAYTAIAIDFDIVVNIQGDEPFIHPDQIDLAVSCFDTPAVQIATLIKSIENSRDLFDVNRVKVIRNARNEAIYFSRHPIPYFKDLPQNDWLENSNYFSHIGLYAYRSHILSEITQLAPSGLEKAESLEQLRWLENGYRIRVAETTVQSDAIDSPADLEALVKKLGDGGYIY
jgi:3-deoxy-manno-octulosonate cytidylyltransferase (CMP-KDO synthetase)